MLRDSERGKLRVARLIKVWLKDGSEKWVLIHIEVQSDHDAKLAFRLFCYHHRIVDHYDVPVATLVVLGDESKSWKPTYYHKELWNCRTHFEFPVCKLLELETREDQPLESDNPISIIIAAHLAAKRSGGDLNKRKKWKWALTRRLYERGYDKETVIQLFRLIDWLIVLGPQKEVEFRKQIFEYEKQKMTPYITSIERLGRKEGRKE